MRLKRSGRTQLAGVDVIASAYSAGRLICLENCASWALSGCPAGPDSKRGPPVATSGNMRDSGAFCPFSSGYQFVTNETQARTWGFCSRPSGMDLGKYFSQGSHQRLRCEAQTTTALSWRQQLCQPSRQSIISSCRSIAGSPWAVPRCTVNHSA